MSRGWALVVPNREIGLRWMASGKLAHPVSSIATTAREALALLGGDLVDGVMVLDFAWLDGVVEVVGRQPANSPVQRRVAREAATALYDARPTVNRPPPAAPARGVVPASAAAPTVDRGKLWRQRPDGIKVPRPDVDWSGRDAS